MVLLCDIVETLIDLNDIDLDAGLNQEKAKFKYDQSKTNAGSRHK